MELRRAQKVRTRIADLGNGGPARVDRGQPSAPLQGVVDDLALHGFQGTWSAPGRRRDGSGGLVVEQADPMPRHAHHSVRTPVLLLKDLSWTPVISVRYIGKYIGVRCRLVRARRYISSEEVVTDHRRDREGGGEVLELAILGLLLESPMHGYELRKRLTGLLGAFRAFSYGSLYPTLRRMQADGLIDEPETPLGVKVRRGRRVYQLTDAGRERFAELIADTGPQNYTDDGFGVHLAFFSRTPAVARMRILEGRRRQVEERREGLREIVGRSNRAVDRYTRQLHQLSLESSEREVRWLNELIAAESSQQEPTPDPFDGQFDDDLAEGARSPIDSGRPTASPGRADDDYQDPDSTPSRDRQLDEPEQRKSSVAQRTTAMPREEGEPDHG